MDSKLWVHVVAWNYDGGGGNWWTTNSERALEVYEETLKFFGEGVALLCMSLPDIAETITKKVDDDLWLDPVLVEMPAPQIKREIFI